MPYREGELFTFYNLYDFLATIVPGGFLGMVALGIAGAFSQDSKILETMFGEHMGIQAFGLLALAFLVGHILHPVGNALEHLIRRFFYQDTSTGQVVLVSGTTLSEPFREKLHAAIVERFDVPASCSDAYYLCYTDVLLNARNSLAARLRALRGFYRELCVAGTIGTIVTGILATTTLKDTKWLAAWGLLTVIVSITAFLRYLRFSKLVAAITLRTFYVRERANVDKKSNSQFGERRKKTTTWL